ELYTSNIGLPSTNTASNYLHTQGCPIAPPWPSRAGPLRARQREPTWRGLYRRSDCNRLPIQSDPSFHSTPIYPHIPRTPQYNHDFIERVSSCFAFGCLIFTNIVADAGRRTPECGRAHLPRATDRCRLRGLSPLLRLPRSLLPKDRSP